LTVGSIGYGPRARYEGVLLGVGDVDDDGVDAALAAAAGAGSFAGLSVDSTVFVESAPTGASEVTPAEVVERLSFL